MSELSEAMKRTDEAMAAEATKQARVTAAADLMRAQMIIERDLLQSRIGYLRSHIDAEMERLRSEGERLADLCRTHDAIDAAIRELA